MLAACRSTTSNGSGEVVRIEPDRGAIVLRRDDLPGMTKAVDVPVVQHETQLQIVADYRLRAAAVWRF